VIRAATAKEGSFAITVNDVDTIGVIVRVERERGASGWKTTLDVLGGLEFTMLNQDNDNITVKVPHIPPRAGAVGRVFTPLTMARSCSGITFRIGLT
jgi:hypothetical protein